MIICGFSCGCEDNPLGNCLKEKSREDLEGELAAARKGLEELRWVLGNLLEVDTSVGEAFWRGEVSDALAATRGL